MQVLHTIIDWAAAHPLATIAIVVYVLANVMPRPHPEDVTNPWHRTFWAVVDGLCVLTAGRVPGRVKWLLSLSPALAEMVAGEKATEQAESDESEAPPGSD